MVKLISHLFYYFMFGVICGYLTYSNYSKMKLLYSKPQILTIHALQTTGIFFCYSKVLQFFFPSKKVVLKRDNISHNKLHQKEKDLNPEYIFHQ